MQAFKDKVAVITGAASGIGRALAERCAHEGMKVVLADVDMDALTTAEAALHATGAPVLAVETDVSKAHDVEALAQRTLAAFGAIHLGKTSALSNKARTGSAPVSTIHGATSHLQGALSHGGCTLGHGGLCRRRLGARRLRSGHLAAT